MIAHALEKMCCVIKSFTAEHGKRVSDATALGSRSDSMCENTNMVRDTSLPVPWHTEQTLFVLLPTTWACAHNALSDRSSHFPLKNLKKKKKKKMCQL